MAEIREKLIEKKVRAAYELAGWFVFKVHGGPMQAGGFPDFICFRAGVARLVEIKNRVGRVSPLQYVIFSRLEKYGFPVLVVRGIDDIPKKDLAII